MFWRKRRGNVSPTMVDASVCTEETSKCDVGMNTEDMVFEGDMNSHQAPPPCFSTWTDKMNPAAALCNFTDAPYTK